MFKHERFFGCTPISNKKVRIILYTDSGWKELTEMGEIQNHNKGTPTHIADYIYDIDAKTLTFWPISEQY